MNSNNNQLLRCSFIFTVIKTHYLKLSHTFPIFFSNKRTNLSLNMRKKGNFLENIKNHVYPFCTFLHLYLLFATNTYIFFKLANTGHAFCGLCVRIYISFFKRKGLHLYSYHYGKNGLTRIQ